VVWGRVEAGDERELYGGSCLNAMGEVGGTGLGCGGGEKKGSGGSLGGVTKRTMELRRRQEVVADRDRIHPGVGMGLRRGGGKRGWYTSPLNCHRFNRWGSNRYG